MQLPHKFLNPERPVFADQLQMLQPQEKFSSGEMNSSASRGGPDSGAGGGGDSSGSLAGRRESWLGGGEGWCVTVPVGLAWLCWDTSHFCHFWPEGSPC